MKIKNVKFKTIPITEEVFKNRIKQGNMVLCINNKMGDYITPVLTYKDIYEGEIYVVDSKSWPYLCVINSKGKENLFKYQRFELVIGKIIKKKRNIG